VTNLAARLCSEARQGQILVEQKTMTSIEGRVRANQLGEMTLKGIAYPVRVFQVIGLHSATSG